MAIESINIDLPPGYEFLGFDELDSTSDHARTLAADWLKDSGAKGLWIWTEKQTQGRGRRGRAWSSAPGNLTTTLLLRVNCPASQAAELSFVAALSIYDTLAQFVAPDAIQLKWPNDVLLEGAKTAGILLESSGAGGRNIEWISIGFGLNLTHFPQGTPYPATSLEHFTKGNAVPSSLEVLAILANQFEDRLKIWQAHGFSPVREDWLNNAKGLNQSIIVRLGNEELVGTFVDLTIQGALVLEQKDATRKEISAGEVFFEAPIT